MIDISDELFSVQEQENCSELLAFIMLKYGFCFQQSESKEQPCGRLCDTRNSDTDESAVGGHIS